jgi:hypothetical protein
VSTPALQRIGAVVRADVMVRVRRPASIAVFLVLCALAYVLVPDPRTGETLMQVNGHRATLNSATIALATAALLAMLLGMLGFYLVSNAIRRDIVTRTGFVIAAMPVRNAEYLIGKFLGSVVFLGLVVLGYMLNVMAMHLLRGEAPLEPGVYLATFLALTGPAVIVVSAIALMFESVRWLSGRVGDVLYFFVWMLLASTFAIVETNPGVAWPRYVDVLGLSFVMTQVGFEQDVSNASIGHSSFDPGQTPFTFGGIHWSWSVVGERAGTALIALPILAIAWICFARFNPARIKSRAGHARRNPVAWLNRRLKPVTRMLLPLGSGGGTGALSIARSDFALTFMLSPLALVWAAGLGVWALLAPAHTLLHVVLPLTFLGVVVVVSDIATRDRAAGTTALLYSMPAVQPAFVPGKFGAAFAAGLLFLGIPLVRLLTIAPASALSGLVGCAFVAAAAISLGTLTGSSKTFTGLFLLFLYIVMSSPGAPAFDFAGWNQVATGAVRAGYLVIAAVLLLLAALKHRVGLRAG